MIEYLTFNLGKYGNIEVIVYGPDSIYAKNQILKNSPDPLARSIAAQELLELMNVVIVPSPPAPSSPPESATGAATSSNTSNVAVARGLARE